MKRLLASSLVAVLVVSVTGCDSLMKKKSKAEDGESANHDDGKTSTKKDGEKGGKGAAGCALPEGPITTAVTLTKGCSLTVKDLLVIEGGGVLELQAGVTLAFAASQGILVRDGKLVAAGTEKEPVVFTSANATKGAGDWAGIIMDGNVTAGTELANARIEYAGAEAQGSRGGLTIQGQVAPKRIGIVSTTFEHNARAAVFFDQEKGAFAKFEKNTLKSNTLSMDGPVPVLGSIGSGNTFGDPLQTFGPVSESTTWPAFGAPVVVREAIRIGGDGAAPTLTIASGTTVKFAGSTYLSVGEGKGGGLVAPKVTFTSANDPAHEGDWAGIFLYREATNVDLDGATIDYAGSDASGARAAITFYDGNAKDARGVKLTNVTVKNAKLGALASPDNDCGPYASQVTATGVPVCRSE